VKVISQVRSRRIRHLAGYGGWVGVGAIRLIKESRRVLYSYLARGIRGLDGEVIEGGVWAEGEKKPIRRALKNGTPNKSIRVDYS